MAGRLLGVVVAGGGGASLDPLVSPGEAALTPFAGKYRFIDFALATLGNSGIHDTYVVTPETDTTVSAHVAWRGNGARPPHVVRSLSVAASPGQRRIDALRTCCDVVAAGERDAIVVLGADHILQVDLRPLAAAHRALRADVTLVAVPGAAIDGSDRTILRLGPRRRVLGAARPAGAASAHTDLDVAWGGDFIVRAAALPAVLATLAADAPPDDAGFVTTLAERFRVVAHDVLDGPVPGASHGAYWHEPFSLEAYYDAQMNLCTPRPRLDLYNPAWPVRARATGLAPAKVVADPAGRAGQALNSLVCEGSMICGGVVVSSVVGHAVLVESGAEVEDSVLLEGCRIGRGALVRRALVGPGAVVADGQMIGYGAAPSAPGRLAPSGLTVVVAPAR